ncbi:MAG: nucleoside phosphorylase [Chloroflexota bacterium]
MSQTLYLKCTPDDLGDVVLLTGDPARVKRIAGALEDVREVASNREFYTVTGTYDGLSVSGVSSGIGAPSAAIAIEEMVQLGVRAIVRVGTMMGVLAPLGVFVLATGAARYEGTSVDYLPMAYPAVPDWGLSQHLLAAAEYNEAATMTGITATFDSFYPRMAPALVGRGLPQSEELREAGVMALDMETALLYVAGMRLNVAVASMCLVTNEAEPFAVIDASKRTEGEDRLIRTVLKGLRDWHHGQNTAD